MGAIMGVSASVRDHIWAIEESPEWVISLGEMIQDLEGCSTAIAAARARDLYRLGEIGKALEYITQGWQVLRSINMDKLSPMQRETIEIVVINILEQIKRSGTPSSEQKEDRGS